MTETNKNLNCRYCVLEDFERSLDLSNLSSFILNQNPEITHRFQSVHSRPPNPTEAKNFYTLLEVFRRKIDAYPESNILEDIQGNVAFASGQIINNGQIFDIKLLSVSNEQYIDNLIEFEKFEIVRYTESNQIFAAAIKSDFTHKYNLINRSHDTEYKILENIFSKLTSSIDLQYPKVFIGKITMFSERRVCESCANVIGIFKNTFPNIELDIIEGFGDYINYNNYGIQVPDQSVICNLRRSVIGLNNKR